MSSSAGSILERRRLRRRATLWRALAAVVAVVALLAVGTLSAGKSGSGFFGSKHVARVEISGVITSDRQQIKLLQDLREDQNVAAVILAVNSPGGTTTGGEALYEEIRRLADAKPVVAVFDTIATSAAYIVGLATDRIIARGNTITGSVGVVFQTAEVSGLMENVGVSITQIASGDLKAVPTPFKPITLQERALLKDLIDESFGWFIALVEERRGLNADAVNGLTSGRIYSGRQALDLDLVDEIGGEREARSWLEKERSIAADLELRDRRPATLDDFGFFNAIGASLGQAFGESIKATVGAAIPNGLTDGFQLDGLVSVWHGTSNK